MAQVSIIRHNPISIFSNPIEVIVKTDDNKVFRLVEPSGNIGTQYPGEVGSEWFGTIENLNKGLLTCGVHWSDVYKTDILWTTPSANRDACDARQNAFNRVYDAMINAVTGGPLRSNRMARFTHPEGFPAPKALFEVQIRAVKGDHVKIGGGKIDYGTWIDHQPSSASVMHKEGDQAVTTLGPDLAKETEFILEEQYAKSFAEQGVDFRKQTVWMEILVGVDDDPAKAWERIEIVRKVFADYFGGERPAGLICPVSRITNLDGVVELQPRVVSGDVKIRRSGEMEDGFSTWTALEYGGVTETLVSAAAGDDSAALLGALDRRIKASGGQGLKENGLFNNAYVVAGADSTAARASLVKFNESYIRYYAGAAPAGRTAQFIGGIQRQGAPYGISTRALFAG